jgi:CubicO group peptidase (beta-lactamase class C family)
MSDLETRIDALLREEEASGFAGVVLIARAGVPVIVRGYGHANRARQIPMGPETVLSLGSVTKQFTGAAILTLEADGVLSAGDRLSELMRVPEDKRDITLHHLLTHTAGLESDFADDFDPSATREWYLQRVFESKLRTQPGSLYHYSNAGFSLLAAAIETVSGTSYEEYVHRALFEPAGMLNTGYQLPHWNDDAVAHGYVGDRDWGTILERPMAADGPYWNLRGNGGVHTTVLDMLRWDQALRTETVLSPTLIRRLQSPYVPENGPEVSYYGFGWAISRLRHGGRLVSHDGGDGIFNADLRRYLDDDLLLVSFSNVAEHSCIDLSPTIESIIFESEPSHGRETSAR